VSPTSNPTPNPAVVFIQFNLATLLLLARGGLNPFPSPSSYYAHLLIALGR
jgi:hypothetical protein